jgi:hypothetical protein
LEQLTKSHLKDAKAESYEDAFEHFLGEKYALKEEEEKEVKEGEEVELKENAGTSIDNFINSFDFSQKGNDELIDFAHRLLNRNVSSGEFEKLKSYFGNDLEFFNFVSDPSKGVKAIAQQIYQKLKQGVGNTGKIETWATDPMALQSFNMNPKDVIKLDVPLFIRLLEYAREDAKDDMELHRVAGNVIELAKYGETLGMIDYLNILGPQENIDEMRRMQIRAGIIK